METGTETARTLLSAVGGAVAKAAEKFSSHQEVGRVADCQHKTVAPVVPHA
jgi:hypothetical protein